MSARHDDPRLLELLAGRVLGDLDEAETRELEAALAQRPELAAELAAERSLVETAAALDVHFLATASEPLSERLVEAILRDGERELARLTAARVASATEAAAATGGRDSVSAPSSPPPRLRVVRGGWLVAAAASVLALLGWWPRLGGQGPVDSPVRDLGDAIRVAWQAGPDPIGAEVAGEVVWSSTAQRGEMTFRGLAANDPAEFQYQLWIFDREQSEATPVDGGVFDVGPGGEVSVPIDAKLAVREPYLFAITVEKPGGVVVSSRERLALIAPVG